MSLHEHMEHVGHAGHEGGHGHGGGIGKYVGITMAILGVLLALCSAMVGGARTELIATMVRQTNTSLLYTSVATKYRMLQAQLQQLHALLPSDPAAFKHTQLEVDTLARSIEQSPAAKGPPQVGPLAKVVRLESESILNSVVPTREDVVRFAELIRGFDKEREAAHEWAESYDESIEAYSEAAEHYEWGQLAAEIGIVIRRLTPRRRKDLPGATGLCGHQPGREVEGRRREAPRGHRALGRRCAGGPRRWRDRAVTTSNAAG